MVEVVAGAGVPERVRHDAERGQVETSRGLLHGLLVRRTEEIQHAANVFDTSHDGSACGVRQGIHARRCLRFTRACFLQWTDDAQGDDTCCVRK